MKIFNFLSNYLKIFTENYLTKEEYDASVDNNNKYGTYLRSGFTCGGISAQRGYKFRQSLTECNDLFNDAVMFVKNCFDRDPKQFFTDSNQIFK